MSFKEQLLLLTFLFLFVPFFERSYQLQSVSELSRQLSAKDRSQSNIHFLVKRNKRQRYGKMKVARVHDDMACIQQCSRLVSDGCIAVNFKKDVIEGLHDCELLAAVKGIVDDDLAFEDNHGFDYFVIKKAALDCAEIVKASHAPSGVYLIRPAANFPVIQVMCDMTTDGGGWTVIQNRQDGSVDFYRDWAEYKRGFGNKLGEYWLGLDAIHSMTSQGGYRLRIDLEDFEGNTRYAEYDTFIVAGEEDNYRLSVGGYKGNAHDSLISYHNNMQFSTKDRDNDVARGSENCAVAFHGAWWYSGCHQANLNGMYLNGRYNGAPRGTVWLNWLGYHYSLKRTSMKIRPKDF